MVIKEVTGGCGEEIYFSKNFDDFFKIITENDGNYIA